MPGILPMKVIKVGSSSQSRIAQACDRCRSKKIRCDGIRPTCSQCANVGFECRTSDKLSRRAFPRGYTESLEERVRQLEAEVRELKDLLDEKDEKIDMLSKMHGNRRLSVASVHSSHSASTTDLKRKEGPAMSPVKEDTFRIQATPLLLGVENSDSYFMGGSSGRSFIESFKRKIQENGKSCSDFNPEAFLHIQGCYPLTAKPPDNSLRIPPRLFSDRCVNIYFQEWAPLFPVLHKPTFLRVYEEFVADPDKIKSPHKLAQLYLVFSIAALSTSDTPDTEHVAACEVQWQRALDRMLMDNTMHTLQCLVLALMYCAVRADYKRLQHYKGIAVGLSHRLGLHQSQKRFSFGALTIETRKKVFWTLYTLDCFSAAILGLPKLLKDDDVHAEYPSDTDDEYVTEKGFQPTLPGEFTRLSSALALFRCARILGKVLDRVYPSATTYELSMQQLQALEAELDDWKDGLPNHLKLTFAQDKPSTDVTGSRSPLLSLAYYYTRVLIYRPAVGSTLGHKAAPALISISDASKHIIQIIELLEERSMTLSFCLNKTDVLVVCGMTLLYQVLDLKHDSKLGKDNHKLVNGVIRMLIKSKAPGSVDFKRIAGMLIPVDEPSLPTPPHQSPEAASMPVPPSATSPTTAQTQKESPPLPRKTSYPQRQGYPLGRLAAASMSETDLLQQQEKLRRMTMPVVPSGQRTEMYRIQPSGRRSLDNSDQQSQQQHRQQQHLIDKCEHRLSMSRQRASPGSQSRHSLDYLALSSTPAQAQNSPQVQSRLQQLASTQSQHQQQQHQQQQLSDLYSASQLQQKLSGVSAAEWEALLGSLDGGQMNVYDAIYGGPGLSLAETPITATPTTAGPSGGTGGANSSAWSPDSWDLTHFNIGDFGGGSGGPGAPRSVLSMSDESLSSGEEVAPSELGLSVTSSLEYPGQPGGGIMAPCSNGGEGYIIDSLDGGGFV